MAKKLVSELVCVCVYEQIKPSKILYLFSCDAAKHAMKNITKKIERAF